MTDDLMLPDWLDDFDDFKAKNNVYYEPKFSPGMKLIHTLSSDRFHHLNWSPDGQILAAAASNTIELWNPTNGQLIHTLQGHTNTVYDVEWSPDGRMLASASADNTIRLWTPLISQISHTMEGHVKGVNSIVWSPDGRIIASASADNTIRLWNPATGKLFRTLEGHTDQVSSVAWAPEGGILASASADNTIQLWNPANGELLRTLEGHTDQVSSIAWAPEGRTLASASADNTIRLWNPITGQLIRTLEGHTDSLDWIGFSSDGRLLASKASDGIRLWRCDTWETVATLAEKTQGDLFSWPSAPILGGTFHPTHPHLLAVVGNGPIGAGTVIRIFELDIPYLLRQETGSVGYANARAVLVGDSGVGKSGLALALMDETWVPTESTHGRKIYTLADSIDELPNGRREQHEILLWDLAGQPGYRVLHQLSLTEVTVALLCFDARSDQDPFVGVKYWNRALKQAQKAQGDGSLPVLKFLVATRTDRGGLAVSRKRIKRLVDEMEFDGYFETSAKEGWQIDDLRDAICEGIQWDSLPRVSSTEVLVSIKDFLTAQKEAGLLLIREDALYTNYRQSNYAPETKYDVRAEFSTVIGRVAARGLIRRLAFGNLILLQPELLDAYASSMIFAAREEPNGLGLLAEEFARDGCFTMPEDERVPYPATEKLLLLATIEDMLRHEIAQRDSGDLIFPSQFRRERSDYSDPAGKAAIYAFEGAVQNIFTRLVVRLARSNVFERHELWRNAVTYRAMHGVNREAGGICGMILREFDEGKGALTLFYDDAVSAQNRRNFEGFINLHLMQHATVGSISVQHMLFCSECGYDITAAAQARREMGKVSVLCSRCETRVRLAKNTAPDVSVPVRRMNEAANQQREREAATYTLQGKIATDDFDVFICHNSADKPIIRHIAQQLKLRGLYPWLDEEQLRPGLPWQTELERQIGNIKAAAVFVGLDGIGPWQNMEINALLREFVRRGCPVIPVILPTCTQAPDDLPIFLQSMTWVDFRQRETRPGQQLIWGITGERGRF